MVSNKWLVIWTPRVVGTFVSQTNTSSRATIVDFGPDMTNGPYGNEGNVQEALVETYGLPDAPIIRAMIQEDTVLVEDQEIEVKELRL